MMVLKVPNFAFKKYRIVAEIEIKEIKSLFSSNDVVCIGPHKTPGHLKQVICRILFWHSWPDVEKYPILARFRKYMMHAYLFCELMVKYRTKKNLEIAKLYMSPHSCQFS